MVWRTRFLAVPTGQLKQDDQVVPSSKASPEQMRSYMAQVPAIYGKLGEGVRAEEFRAMRNSPDPRTRAVGDAYHHLFSPDGVDHRIEAEVVDGKGLVVARGRHRIEAAREIGLPYVPVHVRAADDRTLEAAKRDYEAAVEAAAPDVVRAQRELDGAHRSARAARERRATQTSAAPTRVDRATVGGAIEGRIPSGPSRDRSRT